MDNKYRKEMNTYISINFARKKSKENLSNESDSYEPLSHQSSFTSPLRLMHRLKHMMASFVSIVLTTSRCTQRIVKQVKRQHQRFAGQRPYLRNKGPKRAIPVYGNGGSYAVTEPWVEAPSVGSQVWC